MNKLKKNTSWKSIDVKHAVLKPEYSGKQGQYMAPYIARSSATMVMTAWI